MLLIDTLDNRRVLLGRPLVVFNLWSRVEACETEPVFRILRILSLKTFRHPQCVVETIFDGAVDIDQHILRERSPKLSVTSGALQLPQAFKTIAFGHQKKKTQNTDERRSNVDVIVVQARSNISVGTVGI